MMGMTLVDHVKAEKPTLSPVFRRPVLLRLCKSSRFALLPAVYQNGIATPLRRCEGLLETAALFAHAKLVGRSDEFGERLFGLMFPKEGIFHQRDHEISEAQMFRCSKVFSISFTPLNWTTRFLTKRTTARLLRLRIPVQCSSSNGSGYVNVERHTSIDEMIRV
jgi:hypothetical protein